MAINWTCYLPSQAAEMIVHALFIAGGDGSRLRKSTPLPSSLLPRKPLMESVTQPGSPRLIDIVVSAVRTALYTPGTAAFPSDTRLVAVGPPMDLPAGVECVREDPPMSGPASAIAAGLRKLSGESVDDWVLLLAADMPEPLGGVEALLEAARLQADTPDAPSPDGFIAVAAGRDQPLLSLLRLGPALEAFAGITGGSVLRVLDSLNLTRIDVDLAPAADIDTWEEAQTHGFGISEGATSWVSARQRVADVAHSIFTERLARAFTRAPQEGDVLAADVASPMPVPHYSSSAMDGYAVSGPGPWELLDAPAEGAQGRNIHRTGGSLSHGQALPVLTGSLIPEGTTAVIRSEHSQVTSTTLSLSPGRSVEPGADIRVAGEELAEGDTLLEAGTRITARHLALLSTCGVDTVRVLPDLTVDLAFTGNEVITSGVPAPGEVRDAFSASFPALLESAGARIQRSDRLQDDPVEVQKWLASSTADMVIVTGGSGHSGQDFARTFITEQADTVLAHSVRCAPGHPTLLTTRTTARGTQLIMGAPGNPLAAHVALHSFGLLAVLVASGQDYFPTQTCLNPSHFPPIRKDRIRLIPVALSSRGRDSRTGYPTADPMTRTNSHMLSGYARADGLLVVPSEGLTAGQLATYLPLDVPAPR
ncbi:molybdopterin-binding protein [uncultured Corynebacterium sp.]|uniref:molybdopterin-binding protein n=1 Tax=uncultured Corynebacterium sp. TaxID=159447 RepID=UPI0025979973|nr:molybdopterin-binding protein [uncultured Corynebacterium sp.]